jgi:hypothetical protein
MSAAVIIGQVNVAMAMHFAKEHAGFVRMKMPKRAAVAAQGFTDAAGCGAGEWITPSAQRTTSQAHAMQAWATTKNRRY